jgi:predicted metal-binding transcription factor (methanogenesis marker protein 9)
MYDYAQFANPQEHVFRAPLRYITEQDARYIAACHPERIARLLDALEQASKDAERYRALREKACQKTAHDIYGNGCHWSIGLYCDDSRKSFDAAIDAAMERGA